MQRWGARGDRGRLSGAGAALPREHNGIWEYLRAENEPYDDYADVNTVEDWCSAPFTRGVIAGALEVYNAVRPLV